MYLTQQCANKRVSGALNSWIVTGSIHYVDAILHPGIEMFVLFRSITNILKLTFYHFLIKYYKIWYKLT